MLLSFLAVIIKAFDNYVVWMTSEINIVLNHRQNFTKEIRISIHPFIVWFALVRLCRVQFELKFEKKSIAENFGHFRGKKHNNLAFKWNKKRGHNGMGVRMCQIWICNACHDFCETASRCGYFAMAHFLEAIDLNPKGQQTLVKVLELNYLFWRCCVCVSRCVV